MGDGVSSGRVKGCREDAAQTDCEELPQALPQAVSVNAFIIAAGPSSSQARARTHN